MRAAFALFCAALLGVLFAAEVPFDFQSTLLEENANYRV